MFRAGIRRTARKSTDQPKEKETKDVATVDSPKVNGENMLCNFVAIIQILQMS